MYKRLGLLLALVLLAQGCATYHSRYYYQPVPAPRCFDDVCIAARAFSYQDEKGNDEEWLARDSFYVSFRVSDEALKLTDEDIYKTPEERRADADAFRKLFFDEFTVDSLVLRGNTGGRLIALPLDTSRYTPQAANTFTLSFGWVKLPTSVTRLRAVMHLRRSDDEMTRVSDSAVFDMDREEFHDKGVQLLRDNVRGYEE